MEPDMVVEMVGNVMQHDVKMEAIIADDDTAAISNIQRNQEPGLKKYSDKNHIKKNISESRQSIGNRDGTFSIVSPSIYRL